MLNTVSVTISPPIRNAVSIPITVTTGSIALRSACLKFTAAGEAPLEGVSRDALVEGLRRYGHRRALPLESPADLPRLVSEEAKSGDLVVLLGAGDITGWAYALPDQLAAIAAA